VCGDLVGLDHGGFGGDGDRAFGLEPVADPTQPDLAGIQDSGYLPERVLYQGGVDGIHQAPVNLGGGLAQDDEDGHDDQQADRRVGPVPAERYPPRSQDHGQ